MANYNNSQIVDILITFGECGKNAAETARVLNERYPDRHRHSARSILRIISRARQFGTLQVRKNRQRSHYERDNEANVVIQPLTKLLGTLFLHVFRN
ncbi:hypothetical protein X777_16279 [Ooceraea biroi]|uniref:DUF4817 domain-containing protein n=1 Tax=Ooceraea biroi TaxID=2015173 RepID=A0A026VUQ7_OOCBI|nr:hypothetical protein X777_16279 [Ooceraea biroi]